MSGPAIRTVLISAPTSPYRTSPTYTDITHVIRSVHDIDAVLAYVRNGIDLYIDQTPIVRSQYERENKQPPIHKHLHHRVKQLEYDEKYNRIWILYETGIVQKVTLDKTKEIVVQASSTRNRSADNVQIALTTTRDKVSILKRNGVIITEGTVEHIRATRLLSGNGGYVDSDGFVHVGGHTYAPHRIATLWFEKPDGYLGVDGSWTCMAGDGDYHIVNGTYIKVIVVDHADFGEDGLTHLIDTHNRLYICGSNEYTTYGDIIIPNKYFEYFGRVQFIAYGVLILY